MGPQRPGPGGGSPPVVGSTPWDGADEFGDTSTLVDPRAAIPWDAERSGPTAIGGPRGAARPGGTPAAPTSPGGAGGRPPSPPAGARAPSPPTGPRPPPSPPAAPRLPPPPRAPAPLARAGLPPPGPPDDPDSTLRMTPTEDLFDPRATGPSAPNLRQTLESFAGLLPAPDGARGTPVGARPAEAPSAPAVELPPRRPRPASPRGASSVAIFVAGLVVGAGALLAVLSRSAPEPAGVAPAAAPAPAAPAFAPLPDAPGPPDSPAAAAGGRALAPAPAVEAPPPAAPAGAAPWTVTRKGAASTLALAVTGSPAGLRIVRARRALVVKLPRARLAAPPGSHAPEGFGRLQIRRAGRGTVVTVPHAPGARAAAAVRDGELQLTVRR